MHDQKPARCECLECTSKQRRYCGGANRAQEIGDQDYVLIGGLFGFKGISREKMNTAFQFRLTDEAPGDRLDRRKIHDDRGEFWMAPAERDAERAATAGDVKKSSPAIEVHKPAQHRGWTHRT